MIARSSGVRFAGCCGVGMREIKIGVVWNVAQQNAFAQATQLVPTDVWRFHICWQRLNIFVNQVET